MVLVCLALCGGAEAADKKKGSTKPPPPVPSDMSLGFSRLSRDALLSTIKRVGVLPVVLPDAYRDHHDAEVALRDAVIKYLQAAKFEVIGPATYQESLVRLNQQRGGMYDESTGELKREVAGAVQGGARREFASREQLDGFVYVRVIQTTSDCDEYYASWNGVSERSDGKLPPTSGFVDGISVGQSKGRLPALSLLVVIFDKQEQVVFERRGGIQLTSYLAGVEGLHFQFEGTLIRFKDVPPGDLLKDSQRLDRAARVATLPLVSTPKEISLADDESQGKTRRLNLLALPAPPTGYLAAAESPLRVAREQILQSVHRVAVAPVDPGPFAVSGEVQQQFARSIKLELAPLNWEVVEVPGARDLLDKALREAKTFDSLTGTQDESRASAARKAVFTSLGISPAPDAIVWPGLVKVGASHDGGDVEWDGANQNAYSMLPIVKGILDRTNRPEMGAGGISAMSFSLSLTDSNDTTLYRSRGGVQLLQRLTQRPGSYTLAGAELVDVPASELLNDYVRERAAVEYAVQDLVLTPEALAAKRQPPKPGKEKKVKK